jgi:hypothetical protein
MTRSRRTADDWQCRRDLLMAAVGPHHASTAVAAAHRAPALKAPRLLRAGREGPAS